jgi:hypothetical protein
MRRDVLWNLLAWILFMQSLALLLLMAVPSSVPIAVWLVFAVTAIVDSYGHARAGARALCTFGLLGAGLVLVGWILISLYAVVVGMASYGFVGFFQQPMEVPGGLVVAVGMRLAVSLFAFVIGWLLLRRHRMAQRRGDRS